MNRYRLSFVALIILALIGQCYAETVERVVLDFEHSVPAPGSWNTAKPFPSLTDTVPPDLEGKSTHALAFRAEFDPTFQYCGLDTGLAPTPGTMRQIQFWAMVDTVGYTFYLGLRGPEGKDKVDNKKLECPVKYKTPGAWQHIVFNIPPDWPQPLTLASITAHNWGRKNVAGKATLYLDDVRVVTDIDLASTPPEKLVSISIASGQEWNLFLEGEPVAYQVSVDSWLGRPLEGTLSATVTTLDGKPVGSSKLPVKVDGAATIHVPLKATAFGVYQVSLDASLGNLKQSQQGRFAYAPRPPTYTDAEKDASPWGINIHGGNDHVAYHAIARAGFNWVRDYAWNYQWLERAKGGNGKYEGWPYYPRLVKQIDDAGLRLLPCLASAIGSQIDAGKMVPDRTWKSNLVDIVAKFPQYRYWELDNEYALRRLKDEDKRHWDTYAIYHKTFADVMQIIDPSIQTVENGEAGVHPDRIRDLVARGAFANLDVVNNHFYCGSEAPEFNARNFNTGGDVDNMRGVYDLLRQAAAASDSDGHDRQFWITEFGWDTLAGHIVPESVQAAYLQRGYLMQLHAGVDKMFWFWFADTKKPPTHFFDGCGVSDPHDQAKPSAVAMAAMTHLLKLPTVLGTFDVGPNSMGYVARDRGRLVAALFKLSNDGPAVSVDLPAGHSYDTYGNALAAPQQELTLSPVWVDSLQPGHPWHLATGFGLASQRVVQASAGDRIELVVDAHSVIDTPLDATLTVEAPDGWTVEPATQQIKAPVGSPASFKAVVRVAPLARTGRQHLALHIAGKTFTRIIPVDVYVSDAYRLTATPLGNAPGTDTVTVTVENVSTQAHQLTLKSSVPAGWEVSPATVDVGELPGGKKRDITLNVTWKDNWKPTESAGITLVQASSGEELASANLRPAAGVIPAVNDITLDGSLDDWPAAARLAPWLLASTRGQPQAEVYLAWSPNGLYYAARVHDSRAQVLDPTQFWLCDASELFLDTRNDKAERSAYRPTDFQFWVCPLVDSGTIYAGRWKRNQEIEATQQDIKAIKGASRRTDDGYTIEAFFPAGQLTGFTPKPGAHIGLNLNLSVHGHEVDREVYWPLPKYDNSAKRPNAWATLTLAAP